MPADKKEFIGFLIKDEQCKLKLESTRIWFIPRL